MSFVQLFEVKPSGIGKKMCRVVGWTEIGALHNQKMFLKLVKAYNCDIKYVLLSIQIYSFS